MTEVTVIKKSVLAVLNEFPPGPAELIAFATVTTPTTGWTVKLVRAVPQGINPKDLLLKIEATPPQGGAGNVVTPHELRYAEAAQRDQYSQVTITGGNPSVTVPVHIIT